MNLLLIEDEEDFIKNVRDAAKGSGIAIITVADAKLIESVQADKGPAEDQLRDALKALDEAKPIDLVLLDTDLSRMKDAAFSQSVFREALQELGIPVARYSKRGTETEIGRLLALRRFAIEGASAVWVPTSKLDPGHLIDGLVPWLLAVHAGFATLRQTLVEKKLVDPKIGPAATLATALNQADLQQDLLGYTTQNFFFFAPEAPQAKEDDKHQARRWSTRLGYWLFNYVLAFPGPILNRPAAAAYLNLTLEAFDHVAVQALVTPALYKGPFRDVEKRYWRLELANLLDDLHGDIATHSTLVGIGLKRVDPDPRGLAYLCLLTEAPVPASEAAPPLDWIPSGAQLARIRQDKLDELGPMLSM